jgi:hypothetical protein
MKPRRSHRLAATVLVSGMAVLGSPGPALAGDAAASAGAPGQVPVLARLSWLAGCWAAERGEPGSGEQWMAPAGGSMLGMGRTVRGGRTVEHEFLLIRVDEQGRAVYVARPSGQREASFAAVELGPDAVTFENLQHDFPQRILYRLLPGDRLAARIEGQRNGALRGVDFPMQRTACGAAEPRR